MRVREPIQVYLSPEERAELDRAAREQGISRSEALRRALRSVASAPGAGGVLRDLEEEGYVTPAKVARGAPPPRKPVIRLADLLAGLDSDRSDR